MKDMLTIYGSLVTNAFPYTVAKNASGPSASDGTPFTKDFIDDLWGGRQDLMSRAGLTPNGVSEASGSSQFMRATQLAIRGPGEFVLSALNATERALRRLVQCQGQLLLISGYTDLVAHTYCGDANNATAPAFYKCDAGGARNTAGLYFRLPDCRGLFPRGIGGNTVRTAANGATFSGGTFVGDMVNDMFGGHKHGPNSGNGFITDVGSGGTLMVGGGASDIVATTTGNPTTDGANGNPRFGFETRPAYFTGEWCLTY
jgi:hypothetical protein